MKKLIKLIYLIFTAFFFTCTNTNNRIEKKQINRATAINTEFTISGEETALHTRKQVGSENKNKKMSEKEKAEYLAKIENRYKSKDINKMYEEANLVDESAKEYYISKEELTYRKQHMGSHISDETINTGLSFVFDLSPVGDAKGLVEALYGKDLITKEELGFITRIIGAIPIMNDLNTFGNSIKLIRASGKVEAILNDGTRVALNATGVAKYEDSVKASSGITDSIKVEKIQDTTKPISNLSDGTKAIGYNEIAKLDYTLAGGYKASEIRNMPVNELANLGKKFKNTHKGKARFIRGYKASEIRNMTLTEFRRIGKLEGSSKEIRFLTGTSEDALKFFESRVVGEISTISKSNGQVIKMGSDIFGNKVTYRGFSVKKESYPTIELFEGNTGTFKTKIKFQVGDV